MKKTHMYIFYSVCILIVLTICVVLFRQNTKVIEYTDAGFYPEFITIHAGDTITVINRTNRSVWPASDPHPSHTIYPIFDSKKPIKPGGSWSIVLSRIGQWHYHNHLGSGYSQDTGIIVVLEKGQVQNILDARGSVDCLTLKESEKFSCWSTKLSIVTKQKGVAAAFAELTRLYTVDKIVATSCNNLTHTIGAAAVRSASIPENIWTAETITCGVGFYHGFAEVYISKYKNISEIVRLCERLPKIMGQHGTAARWGCYHGMGHGITELFGIHGIIDWKNMTADLLLRSAQKCREYAPDDSANDSCLNGIYNSFQMHYEDSFYALNTTDSDPFWMCRGVSSQNNAFNCYSNISFLLSKKRNFDAMLQEIVPIIPLEYISEVIPAIIRPYLYTQGEEKNYAMYMQLCTKLRTIHQSDACIQSIVRDTFDNGPSDHAFPTAIAFCALPDLLESERTVCLHESGSLLRFYYGDDVWHTACDTITQSYRMACLGH